MQSQLNNIIKTICMMKTKRQVEQFLSKRKYKSQIDFDGISLYCKDKYNLKLHVPSYYLPDDTKAISYGQFANWIENGFGAGDVVKWDNCIGLVKQPDIDKVEICLQINSEGATFNSFWVDDKLLTPADKNASEAISRVLLENHKEFGNPFFDITEKHVPKSGELVKFRNIKTGEIGFGVCRHVDPNGEIEMFCYVLKRKGGNVVKYNMHEYLGNVDSYSFSSFTPTDYERKALETELNKFGKTWNHHMRRIEPLDMRAKLGETYWYIDDKLSVRNSKEKGTATSNKRYLSSNYFKDPGKAIEIEKQIHELIRDQLARPGKTAKKD